MNSVGMYLVTVIARQLLLGARSVVMILVLRLLIVVDRLIACHDLDLHLQKRHRSVNLDGVLNSLQSKSDPMQKCMDRVHPIFRLLQLRSVMVRYRACPVLDLFH